MTAASEHWRPVPGSEGAYEVSDRGRVRSLHRVITRSNGAPYTVHARLLRIGVHRPSGLRHVALATGRRGRYRTVYVHKLAAEVFGQPEGAA